MIETKTAILNWLGTATGLARYQLQAHQGQQIYVYILFMMVGILFLRYSAITEVFSL